MENSLDLTTNTVTLPSELVLYMAQFMPTFPDFFRWVITTCLKRDKVTKEIILSDYLKDLSEKWKYKMRSEKKRYFYISSCLIRPNQVDHIRQKIFCEADKIIYEEYTIVDLHEAFTPLKPFALDFMLMYYVEDENDLLNGRFYVISKDGMMLLGRFKDSQISGDVVARISNEEELRVLPLDDDSLHSLSDREIFEGLRKFECDVREEEILRMVDGDKFVMTD